MQHTREARPAHRAVRHKEGGVMAEPRLYDIKDAARYLEVAPSTLRYWE